MTYQECYEIRETTGLRQRSFAKITGIGIASVTKYEKGRAEPERTPLLIYTLLKNNPKIIRELWEVNKHKLDEDEARLAEALSHGEWKGIKSPQPKGPRYSVYDLK